VHHCEFAPFQDLFPLSAVAAHHGGVGTTAKALSAGVPQLILPFAYDQLDNAVRVKRLGAGDFLKASQRTPKTIAAALKNLMTRKARASAQTLTKNFNTRSGIERAAKEIEKFTNAQKEKW
jgi:UDP:flavonoid glycosyltransferase YjiC (YdhE family)